MTVAHRDEERRDVRCTHVIDVADHLERLDRAVDRLQGPFNLGVDESPRKAIEAGGLFLAHTRRQDKNSEGGDSNNYDATSLAASSIPRLNQLARSGDWIVPKCHRREFFFNDPRQG